MPGPRTEARVKKTRRSRGIPRDDELIRQMCLREIRCQCECQNRIDLATGSLFAILCRREDSAAEYKTHYMGTSTMNSEDLPPTFGGPEPAQNPPHEPVPGLRSR